MKDKIIETVLSLISSIVIGRQFFTRLFNFGEYNGAIAFTKSGNYSFLCKNHEVFGEVSKKERDAILLGLCSHELLHQILTPMEYFVQREVNYSAKTGISQRIIHSIVNMSEDGFIEYNGDKFLSKLAMQGLIYKNEKISKTFKDISLATNPFEQWSIAYNQFELYGKVKGNFTFKEAKKAFKKSVKIFKQIRVEYNDDERFNLYERIVDIVKPLIMNNPEAEQFADDTPFSESNGSGQEAEGKESKNSNPSSKRQDEYDPDESDGSGSDESDSDESDESNEGSGDAEDNSDESDEDSNEEDSKDSSGSKESNEDSTNEGSDDGDSSEKDSKEGSSKGSSNEKSSNEDSSNENSSKGNEELDESLEDLLDEISEGLEEFSDLAQEKLDKEEKSRERELDTTDYSPKGEDIRTEVKNFYPTPSERDIADYKAKVSENRYKINSLSSVINHLIENDRRGKVYSDKGRISVKRLASPKVRTSVFERRKASSHIDDTEVVLMLDTSGSTQDTLKYQETYEAIRDTAIGIVEALEQCKIKCSVIGFDAISFQTRHYNYVNFTYNLADKASLMTHRPRNCNCDAMAIATAVNILKTRRVKHKIILMLSDGMPTESMYKNSQPDKDFVYEMKKALQNPDIVVGGVCFSNSKYVARDLHHYYDDNYVIVRYKDDGINEVGDLLKYLFRKM